MVLARQVKQAVIFTVLCFVSFIYALSYIVFELFVGLPGGGGPPYFLWMLVLPLGMGFSKDVLRISHKFILLFFLFYFILILKSNFTIYPEGGSIALWIQGGFARAFAFTGWVMTLFGVAFSIGKMACLAVQYLHAVIEKRKVTLDLKFLRPSPPTLDNVIFFCAAFFSAFSCFAVMEDAGFFITDMNSEILLSFVFPFSLGLIYSDDTFSRKWFLYLCIIFLCISILYYLFYSNFKQLTELAQYADTQVYQRFKDSVISPREIISSLKEAYGETGLFAMVAILFHAAGRLYGKFVSVKISKKVLRISLLVMSLVFLGIIRHVMFRH